MISPKPTPPLTQSEIDRFYEKVGIGDPKDCWLWQGGCDSYGYGVMKVGGRFVGAHRIAYDIHHGYTNSLYVLHECDNSRCVNPRHLRAGTQKENISDMHRRGRAADTGGSNNGHSRLTEDKVREIKRMLGLGMKPHQIAPHFDVHRSTVSDINTGRTWSHVTIND